MTENLKERAAILIQEEHSLHPAAELIDYYKLFFQAVNGPGHLIEDTDKARDYLTREIREMEENNEPLFQDISFHGNDFCRISLWAVRKNHIDEAHFFEMFLKSAEFSNKSIDFSTLWSDIERMVLELDVPGSRSDDQKKNIDIMLKNSDSFIPCHSEAYREIYKPHYRLIRKEFLKDFSSLFNF